MQPCMYAVACKCKPLKYLKMHKLNKINEQLMIHLIPEIKR
jgi:hypothetical protein